MLARLKSAPDISAFPVVLHPIVLAAQHYGCQVSITPATVIVLGQRIRTLALTIDGEEVCRVPLASKG